MEFIGLGDLHFDKLNDTLKSIDVNREIGKAIRRVLTYAIDNGVRQIIFYGDVADKPIMSYAAQMTLNSIVLSHKYRDLQFHFVLGNHDFAEDGSHSLLPLEQVATMTTENMFVYTKPTGVRLDGVPFMFLPHPSKETSPKHINVGHFEQQGAFSDSGRQFKDGYATDHVTVLGHLHTNHQVRNSYWSGTLYQTNFGESLPKFFHHVTVNSVDDYEVRSVPFEPPWKLLNVTVNTRKDLRQLVDDPMTFYKLFVNNGADIDLNEVLTTFPNVIKHNLFKTKEELEIMVQQAWQLDDAAIPVIEFDEEETLRTIMTNSGLTGKQVSRGLAKLKEYRS